MTVRTPIDDEVFLKSFGQRLMALRLEREWTQERLAKEAKVAKRRVERLEAGEVTAALAGFVRILRALGLLEQLDRLLPASSPAGPMDQLRTQGQKRRRASAKRSQPATPGKPWQWGDDA